MNDYIEREKVYHKLTGVCDGYCHAKMCKFTEYMLEEIEDIPAVDVLDKAEKELAEAKRLLKLAVEDLRYLERHTVDEKGSCIISNNCFECPFNNNDSFDEKCIWNHEAEAEKLLNQ